MTITASKTHRARSLRQVDALQRRIVALHRQALTDILDLGLKAQPRTAGVGYLSSLPIRRRLEALRGHLALLMRQAFGALVHDGHRSAALVLAAAMRGHRHWEEILAEAWTDAQRQRSIEIRQARAKYAQAAKKAHGARQKAKTSNSPSDHAAASKAERDAAVSAGSAGLSKQQKQHERLAAKHDRTEKLSHRKFLAGPPIKTIHSKEVPHFQNMKQLVVWAEKYFKEQTKGTQIIDSPTIGQVRLHKGAASSFAPAHGTSRTKTIAIVAVPSIIQHGRTIDVQRNFKKRGYDSHTIAAPIKISGESYVGIAIVHEVPYTMRPGFPRSKFYLHKALTIKKLQAEALSRVPAKAGLATTTPPGDTRSILHAIFSVKESLFEAEDDDPEPGSFDAIMGPGKPPDVPEPPAIEPLGFDANPLPPLTQAEAHAILLSRNAEGLTWEEQLFRSSHRVADPQAMADQLSKGFSEGEGIVKIRERVKPLVENLSVSAQRIARTEGLRLFATAQQQEFDRADAALERVGRGIAGMVMHCAMMPTSAADHKARNGKFYKKIAPGRYVADDGELYPGTPYGHPNCSCWGDVRLPASTGTF